MKISSARMRNPTPLLARSRLVRTRSPPSVSQLSAVIKGRWRSVSNRTTAPDPDWPENTGAEAQLELKRDRASPAAQVCKKVLRLLSKLHFIAALTSQETVTAQVSCKGVDHSIASRGCQRRSSFPR